MCVVLAAECHQGADQAAPGISVLRLLLEQGAEQGAGMFRVPRVQRGPGLGQQVGGGHLAASRLQQPLDEGLHLRLGDGALEQVGDLALPEGGDGGHRLQRQAELRELSDQGAVLVDVDLDQFQPAAGRPYDLFQGRGELLAGTAPGGPEIDQHRDGARRFHDVLHEGLLVAVNDHRGRLGRARLGCRGLADNVVHCSLSWSGVRGP